MYLRNYSIKFEQSTLHPDKMYFSCYIYHIPYNYTCYLFG